MKQKLIFLLFATGLLMPAVTYGDTPVVKGKSAAKKSKVVATQAAPAPQHETYYIMSRPMTGSNIPMVYRRYNGRIDSAASPAVYGQSDLNRSGQLDVASELLMLDPAFTAGRTHG